MHIALQVTERLRVGAINDSGLRFYARIRSMHAHTNVYTQLYGLLYSVNAQRMRHSTEATHHMRPAAICTGLLYSTTCCTRTQSSLTYPYHRLVCHR